MTRSGTCRTLLRFARGDGRRPWLLACTENPLAHIIHTSAHTETHTVAPPLRQPACRGVKRSLPSPTACWTARRRNRSALKSCAICGDCRPKMFCQFVPWFIYPCSVVVSRYLLHRCDFVLLGQSAVNIRTGKRSRSISHHCTRIQ